jgi:AcrR family transcriptional regulator
MGDMSAGREKRAGKAPREAKRQAAPPPAARKRVANGKITAGAKFPSNGKPPEKPAGASQQPRRRRDREKTVADILDAAERLLGDKGPDGFGLAELGREAGISFGLIHHYFGGKEGLLRAVLGRTLRDMGRDIRRLQEDHTFWRRDAPAVQVVFDTFARSPGFSRLLAWGLLTGLIGSEDVAREFRKDRVALEAMLEAFRVEAPDETRDNVAVITTLLVSAVLGFHLLRPLLVGTVDWNDVHDLRLRSQLVNAMVDLTQRAER